MVLNRKTPIFIATLLIAISCGQAKDLKNSNPSKAGFDEERLKRIDRMIQGCVDRKEVPGAVGVLIKDGKIGYHKAFGWADIESKKLLKKDTLFRIASMSKLITTVAALQLFEKAEYNMHTELGSILPEFKE
ncbi:MAG: serine hydrolase, partial [Gammaproteobacteria bacterium]|nr:serine hydrolase [Gammaproteobacteria bacterium]